MRGAGFKRVVVCFVLVVYAMGICWCTLVYTICFVGRYEGMMDRKEIEQQLRRLPRDASVAFAARVALRMLPLLAASNGVAQPVAFWYWPESGISMHLLTVLMACQLSVLGAFGKKRVLGGTYRAAAHAAARAAARAADHADAAAFIAYDAAYVAYLAADVAAGDADDAATRAAAVAAKFKNHYSFTGISKDLHLLINNKISAIELIQRPLWSTTPSVEWQQQFTQLLEDASHLNLGFNYWTDWLQTRVAGGLIDVDLLEQACNIPEAVEAQGVLAINAYLANLPNATKPLNRVRAIFIGYGDAGKTSVIRMLHDESVVEGKQPMTPGIEIREWLVPDTAIRAHFWDFGGQVMVHATHQLFLRDACLYVLVISARSEINATEQAEYWLEHIKSFGKNSPVIIVGNKDDQTVLHLDMSHLTQKYPNIVKFFPLSCTQAQGGYRPQAKAFRHEFCRQLRALTTHQMHFTPAQFMVLQSLRELTPKASFLSRNEFVALCIRHQVDEKGPQDRAWLLDILDKLGVIIHFPQLPFMDGYVLNPNWLTYGVYTLMYSKRARLRQQDIIHLLSKEQVVDEAGHVLAYPPDKCRLIMDAMCEFKLCYPLMAQPDTLIIPALLPANQPAVDFDKATALAFSFDFAVFLPRHIMSELIVQRHQEIDAETVWQTGVVLAHRTLNGCALLQVDYHARTLQLWVSGREARNYLMLLCDEIQMILGRIDIAYKEWITLPKATLFNPAKARHGTEERAPYRQLLAFHAAGEEKFITESGAQYHVGEVLQLFTPDPSAKPAPLANVAEVASPQRTIQIFLASSYELLTDRDQFELYFRQQNDHYRAQGIYLEIVRWENFFDAMSATRKQDDYNAALKDCDIFLSLFFTKIGKYTEEEFTAAHAQFKSSGRPYIFTFFKDGDISSNMSSAQEDDLQTLWAFKKKLKALEHFPTSYKDAEHLKRQFTDQLKHLLVPGKLG
jgi:hypothetical protein